MMPAAGKSTNHSFFAVLLALRVCDPGVRIGPSSAELDRIRKALVTDRIPAFDLADDLGKAFEDFCSARVVRSRMTMWRYAY
jgi:hypothetical protein